MYDLLRKQESFAYKQNICQHLDYCASISIYLGTFVIFCMGYAQRINNGQVQIRIDG